MSFPVCCPGDSIHRNCKHLRASKACSTFPGANQVIVGLGCDLVEVGAVAKELARGGWTVSDRVFTTREISWCGGSRQPEHHFAACFAAKEATLKALGTGVVDLGIFHEVETEFVRGLCPRIALGDRLQAIAAGLGVRRITLSVAGSSKRVAAMVVLES